MGLLRETPTCIFCNEVIAKPIYEDRVNCDDSEVFYGDTFFGWDYIDHECRKMNDFQELCRNKLGLISDINLDKIPSELKK